MFSPVVISCDALWSPSLSLYARWSWQTFLITALKRQPWEHNTGSVFALHFTNVWGMDMCWQQPWAAACLAALFHLLQTATNSSFLFIPLLFLRRATRMSLQAPLDGVVFHPLSFRNDWLPLTDTLDSLYLCILDVGDTQTHTQKWCSSGFRAFVYCSFIGIDPQKCCWCSSMYHWLAYY